MPANKQSPADYDGPALGRDDPVWPHYLEESTQRDADLVDGWQRDMDQLLLFAALFSAVVTAFLIESYKTLQPDAALITAAGMNRMVDLVEAIASREPVPSGVPLPTLDNFSPSRSDIAINTLWFFSLALSMSVALIAMLVKQWGDGYRRGDRFSPHYVQARTRQARYNGLKNWGAKLVVRMLPIIMHVALGLFLLGLLLFLKNLNLRLMRPVMAAIVVTLGIYIVTTVLPLFSTFCPYNTPLSSRTLWGCFYAIVNLIAPSGEKWNTLPCERKERAQSTSIALDRLTAQAVVWLVSHSQSEKSVGVAIRAIANAIAGPEFWNHLIKDKLVTLMAQRFTSFFKGTLDLPDDGPIDTVINTVNLKRKVSLCSRALAKIAKHSTIQIIQDTAPDSSIPERAVKESDRIMLPEAYFTSVQNGLHRLTKSASVHVAASGFCGASAWFTSTGRTSRNERGQQTLLQALITFLKDNSTQIPKKLLVDLVKALAVETSYMTWELQEGDTIEALKSAIKLCSPESPDEPNLLDGPSRRAASVELAVIAALINDYQRISNPEIDQLASEGRDKLGIRGQYIKAHEAYELRYPYPAGSYLNYSRQWRAVWIAEVCTKNPKYLEENSDALLFLGLAGILRSLQMDSSQFIHLVKLFITQLKSTRVNHSGRMSLPFILVSSCDVQSQVAQDILAAFHNQPSRCTSEVEEVKIELLRCLVEHGQWIEFRSAFLVEIIKMLKSSQNREFRHQCILALDNYWFMSSASILDVYNLPDWQIFTDFNLIHVLAEAFKSITPGTNETDRLRSSIISCFAKLARTIIIQAPKPSTAAGSGVPRGQVANGQSSTQGAAGQSSPQAMANQPNAGQAAGSQPVATVHSSIGEDGAYSDALHEILKVLKKLLLDDPALFEVFAKQIACGTSPDVDKTDLAFWKDAILNLPSELMTNASSQASSTSNGHQAPLSSVPLASAASASSQALPTNTSPQGSTNSAQALVASGSNTPAENFNPQAPAITTSSQATSPTLAPSLQTLTASTDAQILPSSLPVPATSTPQTPPISLPETSDNSHILSAPVATGSNPQAPSGNDPPTFAPVPQAPPMTYNEAQAWLLAFAIKNAVAEGTLGEMSRALRDKLNQNPRNT